MLIMRRCPHTDVLNFYDDADPHLAVGSVARCGTRAATPRFAWRCYADHQRASGVAPDAATAERRLTNMYAMVQSISADHAAEA
jgi:hypothetical protein